MKKIATLATYAPRFGKIVIEAVRSLCNQTDALDQIHVCANPCDDPDLKWKLEYHLNQLDKMRKPDIILHWMDSDLGDLAKFYPLAKGWAMPGDFVAICDDDLLYPPTYINDCGEMLLWMVPEWNSRVLTWGGKLLNEPPYTNWRSAWANRIGIWQGSPRYAKVHTPLTCVTSLYWPKDSDFEIDERFRNNGDLLFGKWAAANGHRILCPPFDEDYFTYNPAMPGKETIWDTLQRSPEIDRLTCDLAAEIFDHARAGDPT